MSNPTVTRINALTANARSTWLALFSVLVFATVTLVSVEHIDFYGVGRGTQLPLVNITVPTYLFFYAAPILIFAIYGYLHLYLIRLWDALSDADARIDGTRLAEAVSPWLLTDAALSLRAYLRTDHCAERRETDWTAMVFNITITWVATPFILGWIWWQSMPARDFWMTAVGGLMFAGSLAMGSVSLRLLYARMKERRVLDPPFWRITLTYLVSVGLLCGATIFVTWGRTEEPIELTRGVQLTIPLAEIDLQDQRVTERPSGWLPDAIARKEDLAKWCIRESVKPCETDVGDDRMSDDDLRAFGAEWDIKRTAQINDLRKAAHLNRYDDVDDVPKEPEDRRIRGDFLDEFGNRVTELTINVVVPDPGIRHLRLDLRGADLRRAFLAGTNLIAAKMSGIRASEADLEGARMAHADLSGADLFGANLAGADLERAQLQEAGLERAQLQEAYLREAQLQEAFLYEAQLQEADLREAQLQGADLREAGLQEADLDRARLQEADLREAQLQEADLFGAKLSLSLLTGLPGRQTISDTTSFSASSNDGGALKDVDLSPARFDRDPDWRNVFLDGSVTLSAFQRRLMGDLCQMVNDTLSYGAFLAHWRGWLEQSPDFDPEDPQDYLPRWLHNVTPIYPDPDCTWKTGPLPDLPPDQ